MTGGRWWRPKCFLDANPEPYHISWIDIPLKVDSDRAIKVIAILAIIIAIKRSTHCFFIAIKYRHNFIAIIYRYNFYRHNFHGSSFPSFRSFKLRWAFSTAALSVPDRFTPRTLDLLLESNLFKLSQVVSAAFSLSYPSFVAISSHDRLFTASSL